MQVSAISSANNRIVFNTRVNSRGGDNCTEAAPNYLNSRDNDETKRNELFNSIHEWKNFCHQQIEKGNLDIIA